jgi:DNA-binding ferritin-like protein
MSHKIDFKSKRRTVSIDVEELGETITLQALSVTQLNSLNGEEVHHIPKLLSLAIVDENKQRIYTTDEDILNLAEMSVSVMKQLSDAAAVLNGLGKDVVAEQTKKYLDAPNTVSDID